jgi:methylated-DNA-[protein]-cysteine S-methyltransferase
VADFDVKRMKEIETNQEAFCLRPTPFGPVVALWSVYRGEPKIFRILLSTSGASATFLNGEDIQFSLNEIRLDLCSAFQQKVLCAEHAIPRGRVSTYGLIAEYLNNPNGARAVGTALATNPFPILIPCHRAIRSDGTLGGYQGGLKMKRTLLDMEGVAFRDVNHVATRSFFYGGQQTRLTPLKVHRSEQCNLSVLTGVLV